MNEATLSSTPVGSSAEVFIGELKKRLESLPSSSRLNPEACETIYFLARNLVLQGQMERAQGFFSVLCLYAPLNTRYRSGMAISSRALGQFDKALLALNFNTLLEPDEPRHALLRAECLIAKGDIEAARNSLALTLDLCVGKLDAQTLTLSERAKALLALTAHDKPQTSGAA